MSEPHKRIVFKHFRYTLNGSIPLHYRRGKSTWDPAPRGGYTKCFIYDEDDALLGCGKADCSRKDAFCYRTGRNISRGRALKEVQFHYPTAYDDMVTALNPLLLGA